jgi:hypothetical protein
MHTPPLPKKGAKKGVFIYPLMVRGGLNIASPNHVIGIHGDGVYTYSVHNLRYIEYNSILSVKDNHIKGNYK